MLAFEITQEDVSNVLDKMEHPIPLFEAMDIISGREGEIVDAALSENDLEDQTDAAYAKIRDILKEALNE